MDLTFRIRYHELVVKEDMPLLPTEWREKIKHAIETRLTTHPEAYGKPLRRSLKGYRKLRISDYRVIFRIEKETVKIFLIKHRTVAYTFIKKRI